MNSIEKMLEIIAEHHKGQTDKSGSPIVLHVLRVAMNPKMDTMEKKLVAFGHDLLEETEISKSVLTENFSADVVEAINAITHVKGSLLDDYYKAISKNALAFAVKEADIEDNMNPVRLDMLDAITKTRLIEKYTNAKKVLGY
ncbi:MAG: phosphohydrolase [Syntrophales bacterium]